MLRTKWTRYWRKQVKCWTHGYEVNYIILVKLNLLYSLNLLNSLTDVQQFQVPQFITVEDRIIGPFTLKQFLYILGAAAIVLVTWFLFHVILFAIIGVPIAALFLAMAFMKINGQPFPTVFSNAMNYYLKPHLYLWQQGKEGPAAPAPTKFEGRKPTSPLTDMPKLSESKLSELARSLDIKQRIERWRNKFIKRVK